MYCHWTLEAPLLVVTHWHRGTSFTPGKLAKVDSNPDACTAQVNEKEIKKTFQKYLDFFVASIWSPFSQKRHQKTKAQTDRKRIPKIKQT